MVYRKETQLWLDNQFKKQYTKNFITHDPITIPHSFSNQPDVELMGFWAATLAWGQRTTIIANCKKLIEWMDGAPYDFTKNHTEQDLLRFSSFKHRTFNYTDLLYFFYFFKNYYKTNNSLEPMFIPKINEETIKEALIRFHNRFFDHEFAPLRTRKHVSTPERNSACKRLNMYLRWMVREGESGIDFGYWKNIPTSKLICPCDIHVERTARSLGLITRNKPDWAMAHELTTNLKLYDPLDPTKYDFALFGAGANPFE
jgi:uncharacterized protein (TIGR02757 family)